SPDAGRTRAATAVPSIDVRIGTRLASVPAPCSRSTISQSKPARAHSSAAAGESRLRKAPRRMSPRRTRCRKLIVSVVIVRIMPPVAHPLWPLFDLRLRTGNLELRLPTDDDLVALVAVARGGIHPPEEMPFGVAWTDAPSPEFERNFARFYWS